MRSCRSKSVWIIYLKGVGSCCTKSQKRVEGWVVEEFGIIFSSKIGMSEGGREIWVRSTCGSVENFTFFGGGTSS